MCEMKGKLAAKFEEIFGYAPGDNYVPRITNALKSICQGWYRESDLVAIIDTSIFSNGTSGMAITIESICVNDFGNSTTKFIAKYAEIDSTYIREDSFWGTDITALELNMKNGTVNTISLEKPGRQKLKEFIDYAAGVCQAREVKDRAADPVQEVAPNTNAESQMEEGSDFVTYIIALSRNVEERSNFRKSE